MFTRAFLCLLLCTLFINVKKTNAQEIETDPVRRYIDSVRFTEQEYIQIQKLRFSGYFQFQYQMADTAGMHSYGAGDFAQDVDNRFTIRRARMKMTYADSLAQYIIQLDATEKGVLVRDAYMRMRIGKVKLFHLTAGIFDRPFGYEISYSSRLRESPERGRMSQILFPNERDLGAMLSVDLRPKSLQQLKLDMGFFNGTGFTINDYDSKKDFIGRLSFRNEENKLVRFGMGTSLYYGGLINTSKYVYRTEGSVFKIDSNTSNFQSYEKRIYVGANFQINFATPAGLTIIRAEYIQGQQPGTEFSSDSPTKKPIPAATYLRKFNGAYVYLVQNILRTRHQAVLKYDWYDPNTDVSGAEIGISGSNTSSADVRYDTWGLGYIYRASDNIRIMAYYDIVRNEETEISGINSTTDYRKDLEDNLFTLRLQYRF